MQTFQSNGSEEEGDQSFDYTNNKSARFGPTMLNHNSAGSDDQSLNQRESLNHQTQSPKRRDNNYKMRKIKANLESHRGVGARVTNHMQTDMSSYMHNYQQLFHTATKVNHSQSVQNTFHDRSTELPSYYGDQKSHLRSRFINALDSNLAGRLSPPQDFDTLDKDIETTNLLVQQLRKQQILPQSRSQSQMTSAKRNLSEFKQKLNLNKSKMQDRQIKRNLLAEYNRHDPKIWAEGKIGISNAASKIFGQNYYVNNKFDINFNPIDQLLQEHNFHQKQDLEEQIKKGQKPKENDENDVVADKEKFYETLESSTQIEPITRIRIFEDVLITRVKELQDIIRKERLNIRKILLKDKVMEHSPAQQKLEQNTKAAQVPELSHGEILKDYVTQASLDSILYEVKKENLLQFESLETNMVDRMSKFQSNLTTQIESQLDFQELFQKDQLIQNENLTTVEQNIESEFTQIKNMIEELQQTNMENQIQEMSDKIQEFEQRLEPLETIDQIKQNQDYLDDHIVKQQAVLDKIIEQIQQLGGESANKIHQEIQNNQVAEVHDHIGDLRQKLQAMEENHSQAHLKISMLQDQVDGQSFRGQIIETIQNLEEAIQQNQEEVNAKLNEDEENIIQIYEQLNEIKAEHERHGDNITNLHQLHEEHGDMMMSLQNAHEQRDEQVHQIIQHSHAQKQSSVNTSQITKQHPDQQHTDILQMMAELKKEQQKVLSGIQFDFDELMHQYDLNLKVRTDKIERDIVGRIDERTSEEIKRIQRQERYSQPTPDLNNSYLGGGGQGGYHQNNSYFGDDGNQIQQQPQTKVTQLLSIMGTGLNNMFQKSPNQLTAQQYNTQQSEQSRNHQIENSQSAAASPFAAQYSQSHQQSRQTSPGMNKQVIRGFQQTDQKTALTQQISAVKNQGQLKTPSRDLSLGGTMQFDQKFVDSDIKTSQTTKHQLTPMPMYKLNVPQTTTQKDGGSNVKSTNNMEQSPTMHIMHNIQEEKEQIVRGQRYTPYQMQSMNHPNNSAHNIKDQQNQHSSMGENGKLNESHQRSEQKVTVDNNEFQEKNDQSIDDPSDHSEVFVTRLQKKKVSPVRAGTHKRKSSNHFNDPSSSKNPLSPERREALNKTFDEDSQRHKEDAGTPKKGSLNLGNIKNTISSNSIAKKSHGKMLHHNNNDHKDFKDTQGLFTDESESIQHDEDESMGRQNPNHQQFHQSINSVQHSEHKDTHGGQHQQHEFKSQQIFEEQKKGEGGQAQDGNGGHCTNMLCGLVHGCQCECNKRQDSDEHTVMGGIQKQTSSMSNSQFQNHRNSLKNSQINTLHSFEQRPTEKYHEHHVEIDLNNQQHKNKSMKQAVLSSYRKDEDDDLNHLKVPGNDFHNKSPVVGHAGQDTLQSLAVYEDHQPKTSRQDQNEDYSEFASSIKLKQSISQEHDLNNTGTKQFNLQDMHSPEFDDHQNENTRDLHDRRITFGQQNYRDNYNNAGSPER